MKKYSTSTTLVIVESPAKCKKIEGYLGPGYKCLASFGHLRELASLANIDPKNNWSVKYTIIDNAIKQKQIALLRSEISSAGSVLLATDDDREGEAIAWHICMLFDLNPEKTKRIIFHEITESALQKAVQNPTFINMNIVYAQQTRQILDMLIGFHISPLLWKYITRKAEKSLSAGRCQTPALKIIHDNHLEIQKNPGKQVYKTTGLFIISGTSISFDLETFHETEDSMINFLDASIDCKYHVSRSEPRKIYKSSPKPLTTSRIQQAASNEYHFSPKETMKLCQTLYEGGYITYMRTDSENYSNEFKVSAQNYILKEYDEKYLHNSMLLIEKKEESFPEKKTKKTKGLTASTTVAAHEAIRPTNISLKMLPDKMDVKERKMYQLIWQTTLESCMTDASFFSLKASIPAPENLEYTCQTEQLDFPGWLVVANNINSLKNNKVYNILSNISKMTEVKCSKLLSSLSIKDAKNHYSEARLVNILEEKGIGRPSTYSSLVDKIQERGYVKKEDIPGKTIECKDFEMENGEIFEVNTTRTLGSEKGKLCIQPLGIIVFEFLEKHFSEIFNYDYTKKMEAYLDEVAKGKLVWQTICQSCQDETLQLIDRLETGDSSKKVEYKIDKNHSFVIGKHGPIIKCIGDDGNIVFKPVKKDIDLKKLELGEYNLEEVLSSDKINEKKLGLYEEEDLFVKSGKFGLYAAWGEKTKSLKGFGNRPLENISFEEVVEVLEKDGNIVREISDNVSIRKSKKGDYIFFKTPKMKKPQFYSLKDYDGEAYSTCELEFLSRWIREKYGIF